MSERFCPLTARVLHGTPRRQIAFRAWTRSRRVIRSLHISVREIAELAEVRESTAHRVLSLEHCHRCAFSNVVRVRWAAEQLLRRYGWRGERRELWREYDALDYMGPDVCPIQTAAPTQCAEAA